MQEFLRLLATYEVWIYIFLGAIVFIYLRKLILSFQDWRSSLFGLEKESAQRRFANSLTFVGLLVIMALAVFILVTFVVPVYPDMVVLPTPTLDRLATTVPISEGGIQPLGPTAIPTIIQVSREGCVEGQIEWTFPKMGEELSGNVELKGTVNIPNLGFYKYEFSQPGIDNWTTIAAGDEVKTDQPLGGLWNTDQLVPGDYILRLVVSDNQNQILPACLVSVRKVTQ
jgi:hypothetical protein